MCRFDDDYAWIVTSCVTDHVLSDDTTCEDCGRRMRAGEPSVRYVGDGVDGEMDERDHGHAWLPHDGTSYADPDDSGLAWTSDPDVEDALSALGFTLTPMRDPSGRDSLIFTTHQCQQCYAANRWLVEVCDQSVVCVARQDLNEHRFDYDPETLGEDFETLTDAISRQWLDGHGNIIPVDVVERWTAAAVEHAKRVGLHP